MESILFRECLACLFVIETVPFVLGVVTSSLDDMPETACPHLLLLGLIT
jgi:hypothetical protein